MVRCFLIHTVCPVAALGPGESRVLYSRVFGPDEGLGSDRNRELSPEERRVLQKEKIMVVARWVVVNGTLWQTPHVKDVTPSPVIPLDSSIFRYLTFLFFFFLRLRTAPPSGVPLYYLHLLLRPADSLIAHNVKSIKQSRWRLSIIFFCPRLICFQRKGFYFTVCVFLISHTAACNC